MKIPSVNRPSVFQPLFDCWLVIVDRLLNEIVMSTWGNNPTNAIGSANVKSGCPQMMIATAPSITVSQIAAAA